MASRLGRFLWYDLLTTDEGAARAFYTQVVGWDVVPFEGGPEPYTMWSAESGPVGGLMSLPPEARAAGAPPHWLAYVGVDDVDERVARALELGARLYAPAFDIPQVGRMAVLADPQGAPFAVYRPEGAAGEAGDGHRPGEFVWRELVSADPAAALGFYGDLFGWQVTQTLDMGPAGVYRMLGAPDSEAPLGGLMALPGEAPSAPPSWLFYVHVAGSADDAADRIRAAGGRVIKEPHEIPGGAWVLHALDPQGAMFALHAK